MTASIAACRQRQQELAGLSDTASVDVDVLLCHVLGCESAYLRTWPERTLTASQLADFETLLSKRKQGMPVAYLVGQRGFWSLQLTVSPDTLIPRPETELLVEEALSLPLPTDARVLDLGTGTGAVALALAAERPAWQVSGVDRIAESIALAGENAISNGLEQVRFYQSNWFSQVEGSYHLLISNPPYIAESDPHLDQGDVRFEPRSALVAPNEGLADIQHIADTALNYLLPQGYLMFEHGHSQGEACRTLLTQRGYEKVVTLRDLAGLERVTVGRNPATA